MKGLYRKATAEELLERAAAMAERVSTTAPVVSTNGRKADRHKDPAKHREKTAERMRKLRASRKG